MQKLHQVLYLSVMNAVNLNLFVYLVRNVDKHDHRSYEDYLSSRIKLVKSSNLTRFKFFEFHLDGNGCLDFKVSFNSCKELLKEINEKIKLVSRGTNDAGQPKVNLLLGFVGPEAIK